MCDGQVLCGSGLLAKLALEADRQVHCQRRTKGRKSFADLLINRVELDSAVSLPISCRKFTLEWDDLGVLCLTGVSANATIVF